MKHPETLPGSIFGKRLKVVKYSEEDEMQSIVICPYCGNETKYGDTMMISGIVNCPICHDQCVAQVMNDRENFYDRYKEHDYQPHGCEIKGGDENVKHGN